MRIRHLSIRNFRGVRELEWSIPDRATLCLIGRGDSTKSTVLEAIRRVFHPHWSLVFDDSDFHGCSPASKVRIEAVFGQLPEEFHDIEVYALRMSGWNVQTLVLHDDPEEGLDSVLTARLEVGDDLEPSWRIVKGNEDEGVPFRATDRQKVGVNLIGTASDRDLTWSRGSLLARLTQGESIPALLAEAARAARTSLAAQREAGLAKFDEVAGKAQAAAKSFGVRVSSGYKADLDADGINIRLGGLAIHDGEVPLRQLGLGSKRMLATGLQRHVLHHPHITLVDEIELGLEPHRLARLIHHLQSDENGQYFVTTHSPVALREFSVNDLHVVHSNGGSTKVVAAAQPTFADSIQGKIRSHADAFLAPRIIVCEGATEAGFLRGLDDHWSTSGRNSFAYEGIALIDANGASRIRAIVEDLVRLSYDVAVLADSDDPKQFSPADVDALKKLGVELFLWGEEMCIERRIFADVPWAAILASFEIARDIAQNDDRVLNQVETHFGTGFDRKYTEWTESSQLRSALGTAARVSSWFKRQDKGRRWASAICAHMGDPSVQETDFIAKLNDLRHWVDRD